MKISFTIEVVGYEKIFSYVNEMLFSEWLYLKLAEREMSQADLARKAKLSTGAISNYLNDLRRPNLQACIAIAKGLSLDKDDVMTAAGLIAPQASEKDPITREGEFLLSQLSNQKRRQAVDFIRYLAEKGEDYNAASSLEEPE